MKTIKLPKLYEWQKNVYDYLNVEHNSGKRIVIKSFRQGSGKTFLCICLLIAFALKKKCDSIYITPVLKQATQTFNDIVLACSKGGLIKYANKSSYEITFINDSKIIFRSSEADDSIRSLHCSGLLVLDEQVFQNQSFIYKALPLAKVHKCPVILISTPLTSEGFFWDACNSPDWKLFDWSKYVNECFTPEELDFYKRNYTPQAYQTEILGNFLPSNQGLLFTNIKDSIGDYNHSDGLYMGVDCSSAENGDYTAISIFNRDYEMIDCFYDNQKSPVERTDWIAAIINKYKPVKVLIEKNSMGDTYIDLIKRKSKYPITGWVTSNKSKRDMIEHLQMLFEQKKIKIKNDPELIRELQCYQATIKNGLVTFNGKNYKDDLCISTALACWAIKSNLGTYRLV